MLDVSKLDGNLYNVSEKIARAIGADAELVRNAIARAVKMHREEEEARLRNRLKNLLEAGVFAVAPTTENMSKSVNTLFTRRGDLYYLDRDKLVEAILKNKIKDVERLVWLVRRIMDSSNLKYYDFHVKWLESNAKNFIEKAVKSYYNRNTIVLVDTGEDIELVFGRKLTSEELAILREAFTTKYYVQDSRGNLIEHRLRVIKYDKERKRYRIPYFAVPHLIKVAGKLGFKRVVNKVNWVRKEIPPPPKVDVRLYKFQAQALNAWLDAGCRGVIVVPTGGGKTYIGLIALAYLSVPTLICVTTIELARQWIQKIKEHLGIEDVGLLGGGKHDIKDITVAIYNSAVKHIDKLIDKFDLVIFDECLTYDTLVLTDRGWIPIGEIVEKKLPVRVLTHRGRFMPVIGWHKVPLKKKLVKVVLEDGTEVKCTEDHKFLTDRGWVNAIKLSSGDVLYKVNDEVVSVGERKALSYMREKGSECKEAFEKSSWGCSEAEPVSLLSEGVQEQERSWRACSYSTHRQGEERKNSKGEALEKERPREVERSTQKSYGKEGSLEEEHNSYRVPEKPHSRNYAGGWTHAVSEQKEQEREAYDKALFKAIRVCYVEIYPSEELNQNETENSREQGIWGEGCSVQYNVSPVLNGALQFGIYQREADCEREVVGEHHTSNSSCRLVFGQRFDSKWNNENKSMENATRRSGNFAGVVEEEVGYNGKHIQYEKRDCIRNTEEKRHREVHVFDRTLCNSRDEIQDYVYDLTVAEDHSYVANGIIVHNCHHVPADSFRRVAFRLKARKRLGLSATPYRNDRNEALIFFSVGDVVYKAKYEEMVRLNLASPLKYYRVYVRLSPEESMLYSQANGLPNSNPAKVQKLMKIAFNAKEKYEVLKKIIQKLSEDKILVFCQYVEQAKKAYKVIRDVAKGQVVLLTGSTKSGLRKRYFEQFKEGKKRIIVTTTVLDEGIDVPDAETAIIMSGSGTERQMIQRIGRVIRYRPNKVAKVIEIITKNTIEEKIAERRAKVLKEYGIKI